MWGAGGPGRLRAVFGGSLEGKVALVTAGTDGIGLAVAEALGVAGARVFLSSRRAHNVERAVTRLRGRGLQALETFGGVDILVSNAAVNPHLGPALDADESTWNKVFQVNVTAAAMLVRLVVPHMERRGGGAIVLMSSIAGYQPMAGLGPYSVSKTALLGLVGALSPELLPRGIRLNGVAPGLVQTRFSAAVSQLGHTGGYWDILVYTGRDWERKNKKKMGKNGQKMGKNGRKMG
uniref:Dehydrogenase/reductase SDR family member 4 n=1 Tax=Cyanoderma ruficeps TaxID=181631 RepID=A0A8C3R315_9PASS